MEELLEAVFLVWSCTAAATRFILSLYHEDQQVKRISLEMAELK
jgi:hypothetical protein